ncbi:MAG: hypothetical protein IKU86_01635 [Thermoguttaceae bacterium]|nr:hypothetical protein [Thermoguttaceae bacterium]
MTDADKKQRSKWKSAFKKRLKTLFTETLEPLGFAPSQHERNLWERASQTAAQYCNFEYVNSLDSLYGAGGVRPGFCRDCWANAPRNAETQETLDVFFSALTQNNILLKINDLEVVNFTIGPCYRQRFEANVATDVNEIFAKVEKTICEKIVPFFERNNTLQRIINNYDSGSCEYRVKNSAYRDDWFIAKIYGDLCLGAARFQLGQFAEAATHFELAAEKALADDKLSQLKFWQIYAKAMQIGALSIRRTIEEKGPGPRPPKPKQRWSDLEIPAELAEYPKRDEIYELLEKTASPYEPVSSQALRRLAWLKETASASPTFRPNREEIAESRPNEAERSRILFSGTPEEKEMLARYKKKLQKFFREKLKETLSPQGFTTESPSAIFWENETETLRRYCRFSFHKGRCCLIDYGYALKPDFSLWHNAPQDAETQGIIARWQKFETENCQYSVDAHRQRSWTLPINDEELQSILNEADKTFNNEVLPFFKRFRETSDVLRALDAEAVRPNEILPVDPAWKLFCLAILRFHAGQIVDAASCLRELIEKTDETAPDWARLRAEAARVGLSSLEKTLAKQDAQAGVVKREIPKSHALCANPDEVRRLLQEAESSQSDVALKARKVLYESGEFLRRLPEIFSQHLEPQGFKRSPIESTLWIRETQTLTQRCSFTVEPSDGKYFELEFSYRFKPDFTPWSRVPNDAESQEIREQLKNLVEKRLSLFDLKRDAWGVFLPDFTYRSRQFPLAPETILNCLDASFANDVLSFFESWRESSDILAAYDADEIDESAFGNDAATQNFVRALFLFQAERYVESANRFDSLAHSINQPNVYSDAAWTTLLDGARLAAASVRKFI